MKNYPIRISVFYFFVAAVWVFVGDWLVDEMVPAENITTAQVIKGFGFIVITSVALYFIVKRYYFLIRKNEAEYLQLFKDNPHPMWVYDVNTLEILTINRAAEEQYKYTREEFQHLKLTDLHPAEEHISLIHFVTNISDKVYLDSGVWRHKDKSGRIFFVKIASHSTTFEDRKARVVMATDLDQQLKAQLKLQESETKLHGLIDNSDDLIWMIDKQGIIVTANEAFREKFRQLLGFNVELSKPIDVSQLPDSGFTRNWNDYYQQAFAGKHLRVVEEVGTGKTEYYEIILNPIFDENNEIFGVGCFARDITQHKEFQKQIELQVTKLKEVAWIQSHEFRRPVANLLGLMELARSQRTGTEEYASLLEHMENSCKELDLAVKKVVETTASINDSRET